MDAKRLSQLDQHGPGMTRSSTGSPPTCASRTSPRCSTRSGRRNGYMEQAMQLMAEWCRAQPLPQARGRGAPAAGHAPRCCSSTSRASCPTACCSTDTSTSSRSSPAGCRAWALGAGDPRRQALRARRRRRWLRGVQLAHRDRRAEGTAGASCRAAWCSSRPARKAAASICRRTWRRSAARSANPSLVVCLDAECGNYEQVWCTTSLRGNLTGTLRVRVLTEGVHSGMATGIAPDALSHPRAAARAHREPGDRGPAAR